MKVLVLSDIHSNIDALNAVWEREQDSGLVLFAGDLTDYGLNPCEAIEWMRARKGKMVSGNHDCTLLRLYRERGAALPEEPYHFVHHNLARMKAPHFAYLENLPETILFTLDGIDYLMTHSYAYAPRDYAIIESRSAFDTFWREQGGAAPEEGRERRIIVGHTHRSCVHILGGGRLWLNPGSVSYRRTDDPVKGADYAVIIDGQIELRHIDYPRAALLQKVETLNLTDREKAAGRFFYRDEPNSSPA